jgi:DNA-binding beta-propeller fold protein YncE/DNA-binding CsgD family transcriptional regulator
VRELGPKSRLSKRELEVARLVTKGLTNKEIARALFISQRTVEGHVAQICNKLGFSTRAQIAAWTASADAIAAQPTAAPANGAATAPSVRRGRTVIGVSSARWIGIGIIVVGMLGAAFLAMKLTPQSASQGAYVVLNGLNRPSGVAVDSSGAILVADGDRIHKISDGNMTLVAGTGTSGFSGDGGSALLARLNLFVYPTTLAHGLAVDGPGNVYIADYGNHRIRKVDPQQKINTFAGNGAEGGSGDDGPANQAELAYPRGLAFHQQTGTLYIADNGTNRVRVIDAQGVIHAFAGTGETGDTGDDGPALTARLNGPIGVAVDQKTGTVYIADSGNHRVRQVTRDGRIHTVAGTGSAGGGGDGGPASKAMLSLPIAIAADDRGQVYIADLGSNSIRWIDAKGTIRTIPHGLALNSPLAVAVDPSGFVYIADTNNNRLLKIRP